MTESVILKLLENQKRATTKEIIKKTGLVERYVLESIRRLNKRKIIKVDRVNIPYVIMMA